MKSAWKELCNYGISQWFHSYKSFKSIKSANQQSTGCQRGRRQGRSLRNIRPHPAGCEGRANSTDAVPQFLRFLRLRGSPPLPPAPTQKFTKSSSKIESKKSPDFWPQMVSHRDPRNLKNLTKSAKWHPRTPFESSFGRFHFRKGVQVVHKDLQNLKNHRSTIVKQMFSEIHPGLKLVCFGCLFWAFWDNFPYHALSTGAQSGQKGPFRKHQKKLQHKDQLKKSLSCLKLQLKRMCIKQILDTF